jgi:RNA polymerase sigma-70 factor (ECF subfamily)
LEDDLAASTNVIWENFRDSLRRFIIKRVQDEHDAEDILQDVFLKIHNNIDKLKDENKLRSWIYQVTRNAVIDHYRSRKIAVELPELPQKPKDEPPADASGELDSCIRSIVDGLPEKHRQAIALSELKGLTQKEMAENLGISLSGAKSRVQRARGKLKEELLECCHFELDRRGKILDCKPKDKTYPCCPPRSAKDPSEQ